MKKNKILAIICCMLFLCPNLLIPAKTAFAVQSTEGDSALVCLLDASGSMKSNDKNRLAIDGVSRLIYSLPSECKAAVIAYNNGTVFQSDLVGEQGRSELVAHASGIKYAGYTDAGQGLHDAVELLKNDHSSKKTIIILSDGGIEGRTAQKTKQSKELFEASTADASEHGITIYVLGLGSEMKNMSNEIYKAAEVTGGTAVKIESSSQIAETLDKISNDSGTVKKDASYTVDASDEETTLVVPFPYENALKAHIVLSSAQSFEVLSVDAGGSEVTEHKGDLYTVVDVKDPHKGDIVIKVKGHDGSSVKADVTSEYSSSEKKALSQTPDSKTVAQLAASKGTDSLEASITADPLAASKGAGEAGFGEADLKAAASQAAAEASKALEQGAEMDSKVPGSKPDAQEARGSDGKAEDSGEGDLSKTGLSEQTEDPSKTGPSRSGLPEPGGSSKAASLQAIGGKRAVSQAAVNPGEEEDPLPEAGAKGFLRAGKKRESAEKLNLMEALKNRGITEDELMAAVFIIILGAFGALIVIYVRSWPKKTSPQVLRVNVRGGRFGRKGYSLHYSLFRLHQQEETLLSEILASGGIEDAAAGAEKIRFDMKEKGCPVLVNESDCDVRCRRVKVAAGGRKEIPSLLSMRIFVENTDGGLKVRRLIIP